MDKQQTAVEWLQNEINSRSKPIYNSDIDKLFEQAKEIEKNEIDIAHEMGYINGANSKKITGEEYYNQTFGK